MYILYLVKSDRRARRATGNLSFVLVPRDLPGITIVDIDHIGLRYAATTDVIFDDVGGADAQNILGGKGLEPRLENARGPALDVEKLEITATAYGIAAAAVDDAWRYAQRAPAIRASRSAGHQAVRHALVEAKTRLQACRHMIYHAACAGRCGCAVQRGDVDGEIVRGRYGGGDRARLPARDGRLWLRGRQRHGALRPRHLCACRSSEAPRTCRRTTSRHG